MHVFAYLDPGLGSLFVQALIGVVAGAAFIFRNSIAKIKNGIMKVLGKKRTKDTRSETEEE